MHLSNWIPFKLRKWQYGNMWTNDQLNQTTASYSCTNDIDLYITKMFECGVAYVQHTSHDQINCNSITIQINCVYFYVISTLVFQSKIRIPLVIRFECVCNIMSKMRLHVHLCGWWHLCICAFVTWCINLYMCVCVCVCLLWSVHFSSDWLCRISKTPKFSSKVTTHSILTKLF